MDDVDRELAAMTARLDQAAAHASFVAGLLAKFHRDLCSGGLERAEAMELTRDWFEHMLTLAGAQEDS